MNSKSHSNKPWQDWEPHRAVTPKFIFISLVLFVLFSFSAHNTEIDKAAIETSKAVLSVVGIGESDATDRVTEAVKQALTHPLLDVDYKGATGALIHVTCGPDLKLEEFDIIGKLVSENLSNNAQVIIGARISKDFTGKVRVITIMTGVKSPYVLGKSVGEQAIPQSKEISDLGIEIL